MSIPLVQEATKDAINTSIIAIKRNIERINMLLGLSNSEEIDTSEFVKKSDIVDVVEAGNMNPVTSNAVVPVDEVTLGNMQFVTSNAVSKAMSYSTEEQFTGEYWIDGKAIYKKTISCGALPNNGLKYTNHLILNIDKIIKVEGVSINTDNNVFPLPFTSYLSANYNVQLSADKTQIALRAATDRSNYTNTYVTIKYTKTTD